METKSQIKECLKHKFVCGDNFPRDVVNETDAKFKELASCLIEMNIDSEIMDAFLGKKCNGKFKLPEPIVISEDVNYVCKKTSKRQKGDKHIEELKEYYATNKDDFEYEYFTINNGEAKICDGIHKPSSLPSLNTTCDADKAERSAKAKAQEELSKMSLYDIFSKITRFDTPERIIKFFKRSGGHSKLSKRIVWGTVMDSGFPVDSLQECNDYLLNIPNTQAGYRIPDFTASDWYHAIYVFRDEDGDPVRYVAKRLLYDVAEKALIQWVMWCCGDKLKFKALSVPGPQTLYNLELFPKADQPTVVLTDSLELAESNQRYAPDNVIWTSFLCDEDKFDQVDWEPLKRAKKIYYLITNHSGINFAEAYVKAKKLADYLAEKEDIQLDFIQLQVDYSPIPPCGFDSAEAMLDHRTFNRPKVNLQSILFHEDRISFDEMCEKAKQSLLPVVKKEFWENSNKEASETNNVSEPETRRAIELDSILFSILSFAQISLLHACSGLGKSSFVYSMCAAIVTCSKFIEGRFWNTSKLSKKEYKVLYLDYEMDKNLIADKEAAFVDPYFKNNSKLRANLTIESLRDKKRKYNITTDEGQGNVMKLLSKYRSEGTHGGEIDLLVIDSYTKAIGNLEVNNTWEKVEIFLSKLNKMGIAVLIIHHTNLDGKSRGFFHKMDDLFVQVKMHRDVKGTLDVPFTIEIEKSRINKVQSLGESFQAKFDGSKFVVHGENDEDALLEDIFKTYNKKTSSGPYMTQEEIAAVLGMSKNTLRKELGLNK